MGQNPKTGEEFQDEAYVKSGVAYNLSKAKKLLSEGFKETGNSSITAELLVSDTDSSKQTAEYIQNELQKLPGVKITLRTVPAVQLFTKQAAKQYDLTIQTWQSVFADPINFLDVYESNSSYNSQGWKNKDFDKLIDEAENEYANSPEKRWAKLVEAEKVLIEDQGTIPLYQSAKSQLLNPKVKNVVYNPAGVPYDWKTTYIAK